MARKYIKGNPDKNYYDNTKFIGTLATGDPVPEGMFRHLVNFDISDTGQSITPRRGYLTTSLHYNGIDIILSNKTIVFRDPERGKHIIYDYNARKGYVVDISMKNITSTLRLKVEKIITPDYLEAYNVFFDEMESFRDEHRSQVTQRDGTTYLDQTDKATYDSTPFTPDTTVIEDGPDKYILEDELEDIDISNYLPNDVNFWQDELTVYYIRIPVVADATLLPDPAFHYPVAYYLYFYVYQNVYISGNVIESNAYTDERPDIGILVEDDLPDIGELNEEQTGLVEKYDVPNIRKVIARNVRKKYRDETGELFRMTRTKCISHVDRTGTVHYVDVYASAFININYFSATDAYLIKNVKVFRIDHGPEPGKQAGPLLVTTKRYTENKLMHLGTGVDGDYLNVRHFQVLVFPESVKEDNKVLKDYIFARLAYSNPDMFPFAKSQVTYEVAFYRDNEEAEDWQEYKLNSLQSTQVYTLSWTTPHARVAKTDTNKSFMDGAGTALRYDTKKEAEEATLYRHWTTYNGQPVYFLDMRKKETITWWINDSTRVNFTQAELFEQIKDDPVFLNQLKDRGTTFTLYFEVWAISKGSLTKYMPQSILHTVTFIFNATANNRRGIPMYTTIPATIKNVIYKQAIDNQPTIKEIKNVGYEDFTKIMRARATFTDPISDSFVDHLDYYIVDDKLKYTYHTPVTVVITSDPFKQDVIEEAVQSDTIKYTTDTVSTFTDHNGISRVINKAIYKDYNEDKILYLTYKYNGKDKLIVGALDLETHSDVVAYNLASSRPRIPENLQVIYAPEDRPHGHVNYAPLTLIEHEGKYYTNYIYPGINYKFIPYFRLNPADIALGESLPASNYSWAVSVNINGQEYEWKDINTQELIFPEKYGEGSDLEQILKFDNGLVYVDADSIRQSIGVYSQLVIVFKLMPYSEDGVKDEDLWNLQSLNVPIGPVIPTYDHDLIKEIPLEIPEDKEYIRKSNNITILTDNRIVIWYENNLWIGNEGLGYFKEENKFTFTERIVKVLPFRDTLLVFTTQHLNVVFQEEVERSTGQREVDDEGKQGAEIMETVRYFRKQTVLYNILVSDKYKNVIQIFNQNILFYSEEGQLYLIRPSTQIDSDTRYTLQMFNKNVNDILLNYDVYINERLEQYFIDTRITKDDVHIDAQVSINDIKIFFYVPGVITYILKYNVLTNQFVVYDTLTYTHINSLHFIEGGELYITTTNTRRYLTFPYTAFNEDDNNVDMAHYDNFKREPINALLDTGNINLNNHITKRYRDMHVVFKNIDTHKLLFNSETVIDDVISHPFKNLYVEVQELNGNKIIVPVEDMNTIDLLEVTHDATGSFGLLFDFKEFLSNRLITYKTSILSTGKVFRLRMQFISKGIYKIQEFGIIYRERSV